jgi:hypothetical protein
MVGGARLAFDVAARSLAASRNQNSGRTNKQLPSFLTKPETQG